MCDMCNFARSQHPKNYGRHIGVGLSNKYVGDWDEQEDDDDDPRNDYEKDPSLANGWFYNL